MKGVIIMTKQKFGLTGTALKTIALVLMVMDHIHYFLNLRALCRNGSVCWRGCLRRCFCSALWRASPIPMTAGATSCVSGPSVLRWALWNFYDLCRGLPPRGRLLPDECHFQDLMLLCIIWQGIDWLRQRRFVRGALAAAMPILWPICIAALLTLFPKFRTHRSALPCWRGSSPRRCLC